MHDAVTRELVLARPDQDEYVVRMAVGAGIGGAWAGYQMAFGTVIVGWVLAGVAVALGLFAYSKQVFEKLA